MLDKSPLILQQRKEVCQVVMLTHDTDTKICTNWQTVRHVTTWSTL